MKKRFIVVLFILLCSISYSQIKDRLGYLNDQEISDYVKPFATSLGTAFNTGEYYTADVPDLFGIRFSIVGMYIIIPNSQRTFTPKLSSGYNSSETATIWGDKGAFYAGPEGYKVYPPGLNKASIPAGVPQLGVSFMNTEVLIRYLPDTKVGEQNLNLFGIGIQHQLNQYFLFDPVDIAIQFVYNNLQMKNLMKFNTYSVNIHASKTLGLFTAYGGLQWETTKLNLDYTYKGDPAITNDDQRFQVDVTGDNHFRATLGGAIKLAFLNINADASLGSQPVVSAGLTFAF